MPTSMIARLITFDLPRKCQQQPVPLPVCLRSKDVLDPPAARSESTSLSSVSTVKREVGTSSGWRLPLGSFSSSLFSSSVGAVLLETTDAWRVASAMGMSTPSYSETSCFLNGLMINHDLLVIFGAGRCLNAASGKSGHCFGSYVIMKWCSR